MYERLLKQTERYLGNRKEIVVPVKQVWDAMVKEGKAGNFAVPPLMADFECLLEGDKRFEFVNEKKASTRLRTRTIFLSTIRWKSSVFPTIKK
jgi:hypothetical protein